MSERQYIVLCGRVICNEHHIGVDYDFDGVWFCSRDEAIKHGIKIRGSDDFNIGVVTEGYITSLDWMNEQVDTDHDVLWKIQWEVIQPSIEAQMERSDA